MFYKKLYFQSFFFIQAMSEFIIFLMKFEFLLVFSTLSINSSIKSTSSINILVLIRNINILKTEI